MEEPFKHEPLHRAVIQATATNLFYAYITRRMRTPQGGYTYVQIQGYKPRFFKSHAAADLSTSKYISEL